MKAWGCTPSRTCKMIDQTVFTVREQVISFIPGREYVSGKPMIPFKQFRPTTCPSTRAVRVQLLLARSDRRLSESLGRSRA